MKSIIILGSTGSIGTNTLDIVQRFPEDLRVVGMTAGGNVEKLEAQIRAFNPQVVAVSTESSAAALRTRCAGLVPSRAMPAPQAQGSQHQTL